MYTKKLISCVVYTYLYICIRRVYVALSNYYGSETRDLKNKRKNTVAQQQQQKIK